VHSDEVRKVLLSHGYKAAFVKLARVRELEQEVAVNRRHELAPELYFLFLDRLRYDLPGESDGFLSILVVASKEPVTAADFAWRGETVEIEIPPTYVHTRRKELETILNEVLPGGKYRSAKLPLKLLAASAGLAQYGRNNLAYVEGMGSNAMLHAFYTSVPVSEDYWGAPGVLAACSSCHACAVNCPTQCIGEEKFLIQAENCLTRFNELEEEFPSWVNHKWHNALMGCMCCQNVCPENAEVTSRRRLPMAFSEKDTATILVGLEAIDADDELLDRLKEAELFTARDLLPRNLRAVLK